MLQGFLLRGLLTAPLGDTYLAYPILLAGVHIVGAVETPVARVEVRRVLEDLLMTLQGSSHMDGVGGIALQHLIVGDQAPRALGQENLVAEFHRFPRLA